MLRLDFKDRNGDKAKNSWFETLPLGTLCKCRRDDIMACKRVQLIFVGVTSINIFLFWCPRTKALRVHKRDGSLVSKWHPALFSMRPAGCEIDNPAPRGERGEGERPPAGLASRPSYSSQPDSEVAMT